MAKTNKPRKDLSAQYVRRIITYNPKTGRFTRDGKRAGFTHKKDGYVRIKINQISYLAHRLAWLYVTGKWPKHEVDHIFGNRSDNRWKFLRNATDAQTAANVGKRANSLHSLKGIAMQKNGRWMARIRVNKKLIYLGTYDTPQQAHRVYRKAARTNFGEYARF